MSSSLPPGSATAPPIPSPTVINGSQYVPAFNGSYVNVADCTTQICSIDFADLNYVPMFGGNLAYLIIFAVFLVIHSVQGPIYRTWGYMVGLVCGLILEIIGYVARLLLHHDIFTFGYFVMYLVCLTIGPAFISASIYLCLSRLVIVYGQNVARFKPRTYTFFFICCDIISLALQAAGGAISASSNTNQSSQNTGVDIMVAGLSFQVASLAIFMFLGVDFIIAVYRAREADLNQAFAGLRKKTMFRLFPLGLTIATLFIFVRCCFRVAELKNGFGSSLANDQVAFMILEGPMIMAAVLALTIFHPGICFGGAQGWKSAEWTWRTKSYGSGFESDPPQSMSSHEQETKAHDERS